MSNVDNRVYIKYIKVNHHMYSRLNFHLSSPDKIKQDINNFFIEINHYLLTDLPTAEIQRDFQVMIDNFQLIMNYLNINEKWAIKNISPCNKPDIKFIQHVQGKIQTLITTGILNEQYNNIIFEFHRHIPFTEEIKQIYKFFINSILAIKRNTGIHIELVLSAYLINAIIYNNYFAIKILLEDYNVCPAKPWLALPTKYKRFNLTALPITQITNTDQVAVRESFFKVSWHLQEHNFMIMLNKIDFFEDSIQPWHVQEIFGCAFKNFFLQAINYLLTQKIFCKKFEIKEETIIMMAFGLIILPKYHYLINIILNHPNIIKTINYNSQNITNSLDYFTKTLNKMLIFKITHENYNFIPLQIVSDFIRTLLVTKNYEEHLSPDFLMTIHNAIEKLTQENNLLLQHKELFQALEAQLNQLDLETQAIKREYNLLLHKYYVLLRKTSYIQTQPHFSTTYIIATPPAITEHNNYLTQFNNRRHSFYL